MQANAILQPSSTNFEMNLSGVCKNASLSPPQKKTRHFLRLDIPLIHKSTRQENYMHHKPSAFTCGGSIFTFGHTQRLAAHSANAPRSLVKKSYGFLTLRYDRTDIRSSIVCQLNATLSADADDFDAVLHLSLPIGMASARGTPGRTSRYRLSLL